MTCPHNKLKIKTSPNAPKSLLIEIPKDDPETEIRTPSRRLRAVIWRILERESQGKPKDQWENQQVHYYRWMEKIIEGLKTKYLD